jgi:DNA ligase-1
MRTGEAMIQVYDKLYKRTATGAIQVWWMERDYEHHRSHSGQLNGAITTSEWTQCIAKNVGRSNAVSPQEQAELEVAAEYTLKQKKGYRKTIDLVDDVGFKPMLAQEFEGNNKKAVEKIFASGGRVLVQPKLDGMRCIATKDGLVSRNGNPIVAVPHIAFALKPLFEEHPDLILDGELYNHGLKADFPKLMSLVKKQKPSMEDLEASRVIEYHIYDTPNRELRDKVTPTGWLRGVKTAACRSLEEIDAEHASNLEQGYEGSMIRLDGPYEQKRSKLLLKYKPEMDGEFEIVSINEGVGNSSGMAGYAVLYINGNKDRTFRANIMGTREYRTELLKNAAESVGKLATILYFHLTPDGVPRFPRMKAIRDPE